MAVKTLGKAVNAPDLVDAAEPVGRAGALQLAHLVLGRACTPEQHCC